MIRRRVQFSQVLDYMKRKYLQKVSNANFSRRMVLACTVRFPNTPIPSLFRFVANNSLYSTISAHLKISLEKLKLVEKISGTVWELGALLWPYISEINFWNKQLQKFQYFGHPQRRCGASQHMTEKSIQDTVDAYTFNISTFFDTVPVAQWSRLLPWNCKVVISKWAFVLILEGARLEVDYCGKKLGWLQ